MSDGDAQQPPPDYITESDLVAEMAVRNLKGNLAKKELARETDPEKRAALEDEIAGYIREQQELQARYEAQRNTTLEDDGLDVDERLIHDAIEGVEGGGR